MKAIQSSGTYPLVSALFEELRKHGGTNAQDAVFAAGLDMVLDGITQRMASRRASRPKGRRVTAEWICASTPANRSVRESASHARSARLGHTALVATPLRDFFERLTA